MTKTLADLLSAIPYAQIVSSSGDLATPIRAEVVESSLDLQPGGIFVARKGMSTDGHLYIPQAIEAGAAAIIGETEQPDLPVPYVQVKSTQAVLGLLAAAWHDFPSRKMIIIGVTGTDGKTTTCHLLHSIFKHAPAIRAGYISTISADFGDEVAPTGLHVTTPGAPRLQAYLAKMVEAGLTHCILEMTSHGLAQGRLNGVDIDVAVLTNVTHEHLDYHGSWRKYRDAKAEMFNMLSRSWRKPGIPKLAVINADDPSADFFARIPADRVATYGIANPASYLAADIQYCPAATVFRLCEREFTLQLSGAFNISNALAAIATARELGIDWRAIQDGIAAVDLIPGRMERIDEGQDFIAIVDFAHTPNALKRALEAGREMLGPGKRLLAVFGSAGLRDVEKRRSDGRNFGRTGASDHPDGRGPAHRIAGRYSANDGGRLHRPWRHRGRDLPAHPRSRRSDLSRLSIGACRRPGDGLRQRTRTEHVLRRHRTSLGRSRRHALGSARRAADHTAHGGESLICVESTG